MSFFGRVWSHLKVQTRRHFLTGLLVMVPLWLTYVVVASIVGFMDNVIEVLPDKFHPSTYLPFKLPGLGLIVTLAVIQLVGFLSANLMGRKIVSIYESILDRIPFVRSIYVGIKQLLEQVLSDKSDRFRRAVLVEYPRHGIYSIGFVTGTAGGVAQRKTPEKVINVFIPTTPNPTSGYYLLIPEKDLVTLDISVEQAFKMIVSAGMVGVDEEPPAGAVTPGTAVTAATQDP